MMNLNKPTVEPWAPGEDQERTVRFNYDFITELMLKVNVNCPLGNKSYTNKSNYFSSEKKLSLKVARLLWKIR